MDKEIEIVNSGNLVDQSREVRQKLKALRELLFALAYGEQDETALRDAVSGLEHFALSIIGDTSVLVESANQVHESYQLQRKILRAR